MKKSALIAVGLSLVMTAIISVPIRAAFVTETEPNDTPATANPLSRWDTLAGAVNPAGDLDFYALEGVNTGWGFIALLDTTASPAGTRPTLTAYANDGATVLQSDTGSWEHGSGIALQNYASGSLTHYLRVNEEGDDETVPTYTLRYYQTVTDSQPEAEPNETRLSGTPSSFTHSGALAGAGDVDCFSFQGRSGDNVLIALNGDPEGDGSPVDPRLELIAPNETILKTVNVPGLGGKEFLEYNGLASAGVYAYCVRTAAGVGSNLASYKVGLVRNGFLYFPDYSFSATWLNPRPGNFALIGDMLSFQLEVTNTSPLRIPGNIRMTASYSSACLDFESASPPETTTSPGYISWDGQKPGGLDPGETYSVQMNMRALKQCSDAIDQDLGLDYYFTGTGSTANYDIYKGVFLPLTLRSRP